MDIKRVLLMKFFLCNASCGTNEKHQKSTSDVDIINKKASLSAKVYFPHCLLLLNSIYMYYLTFNDDIYATH